MSVGWNRSDHPDEMATAAYLEGALAPEARDLFEIHLASCDPCRAGIHLLGSAGDGDGAPVPAELLAQARAITGTTTKPRRRRMLWPAAAAVLVLGAAILMLARGTLQDRSGTIYRGEIAGAFSELSPAPGAVVSPDALTFRWAAIPGADRYVLSIHGIDGGLIDSVEVRAPTTEWSWSGDTPHPAPIQLVWTVRAMVAGRVLAESRPVPVELR